MSSEPTPPTPSPAMNLPLPAEGPRIPSTDDERTLALICHLGGVATNFVAPLIIWQVKKDQSKFLGDQAKEALNFQLNALGYFVLCGLFSLITCGYGVISFVPVFLYIAIIGIIGGLKANNGETFRYPATIRVIK